MGKKGGNPPAWMVGYHGVIAAITFVKLCKTTKVKKKKKKFRRREITENGSGSKDDHSCDIIPCISKLIQSPPP